MTNLPPVPPIPNGLPSIPPSLADDETAPAEPLLPAMPASDPAAKAPEPDLDSSGEAPAPDPSGEEIATVPAGAEQAGPVPGSGATEPGPVSAASAPPAVSGDEPAAPAATAAPLAPDAPPARAPRPPKPSKTRPARDAPTPGRGRPGRFLAIASLVLGAVAVIGAFVPFVTYGSWFIGVAGMALGVVALLRRTRGRGLAIGGILLSGLGFLLSIILAAVYTIGFLSSWGHGMPGSPDVAPTSPAVSAETIPAVFGQTVTYDDGLQLQVSAPTTFDPSSDARGADQAWNLSFTVTVYNGSTADVALDPSLGVYSAGVAGSPIIDPTSGIDAGLPADTIAVGQTRSWVIGSSVDNPADVTVQIGPAAPYLVSSFTN